MIIEASNGLTWDKIAYDFIGNEFYLDSVIQLNSYLYSDVLAFEGGENINIPESLATEPVIISAPWE